MKTLQMVMVFLAAVMLSGTASAQATAKTAEVKNKTSAVCGQ